MAIPRRRVTPPNKIPREASSSRRRGVGELMGAWHLRQKVQDAEVLYSGVFEDDYF
jgi:hypothetical protein